MNRSRPADKSDYAPFDPFNSSGKSLMFLRGIVLGLPLMILICGDVNVRGSEDPPQTESGRTPPQVGGETKSETGDADAPAQRGEAENTSKNFLLDHILPKVNPAVIQKRLDRILGFDFDDQSDRPEAPEIGEPVFFDLTRPLGDLKYSNELNYLLQVNTGNAPNLQAIEYEYTIADWRAIELDLYYFNANLQLLSPFNQSTLGVGENGNWIHGYQISADIYLRSHKLGGTPVHVFGWKPKKESKFGLLSFVGANRALIGDFTPRSGGLAASSISIPRQATGKDRFMAWRPTWNLDLFYALNDKFTLGIENDLFFGTGRVGEYVVLPFATYKPGEHAFLQAGGGYYHFENRDQFTFFLHINLVNGSPRKPRKDEQDAGSERPRGLRRLLGNR